MYTVIFMTQAQKDAKKLNTSDLKQKILNIITIIQKDLYQYPSKYEYPNRGRNYKSHPA